MEWFWTAFIILYGSHRGNSETEYTPLQSFETRVECKFFIGEYIQNRVEAHGENLDAACMKTDEKILNTEVNN